MEIVQFNLLNKYASAECYREIKVRGKFTLPIFSVLPFLVCNFRALYWRPLCQRRSLKRNSARKYGKLLGNLWIELEKALENATVINDRCYKSGSSKDSTAVSWAVSIFPFKAMTKPVETFNYFLVQWYNSTAYSLCTGDQHIQTP